MPRKGRQTVSDAVQIALDPLQIAFDALKVSKCILGCLLGLVLSYRFVLRAIRNDRTSNDVGALIGVPDRRSLHKVDGLVEVSLVRE